MDGSLATIKEIEPQLGRSCPECNVEMKKVSVSSHLSTPIILDQCGLCGGVWCDKDEMHRTAYHEVSKVNIFDEGVLTRGKELINTEPVCPLDRNRLERFHDVGIPDDIVVEKCSSCTGLWFNRGEFAAVKAGIKKEFTDEKLNKIATQEIGPDDGPGIFETAGRLGRFLSTPLDTQTLKPIGSEPRDEVANVAVQVAMTLLQLLLRR